MSKKKKGFIKKWAGKLHLWLGLGIGAIILIVSITGALYVFKDEITDLQRKKVIYHHTDNVQAKTPVPILQLKDKVNAYTKETNPLSWVEIPVDDSKSYIFTYYKRNRDAWHYFKELTVYKSVYVNQYTGEILAVYDEKNGFFNIVKYIHWSLLLKSSWGTYIVGIPTLIFIFMLITGIILWWPKNKNARKQRFWFNWKNIKSWKRKNYDLHNVLGFYSSFIVLIIAVTGLFYSFSFVQSFLYFSFSGGKTEYPDFSHITTRAPEAMHSDTTLDIIARQVKALYPETDRFSLGLDEPTADEDGKKPAFDVYVAEKEGVYYINHTAFFDANSGALLYNRHHSEKNFGEKFVSANYDIHVGAILGIWGKILAFITSLIAASLPVTGFLVWRGRKKKKKKTASTKHIPRSAAITEMA